MDDAAADAPVRARIATAAIETWPSGRPSSSLSRRSRVSKEQEFLKQARETLTIEWVIGRVVGPLVAMLREAVANERAVFVFDGVDEAGLAREVVEDFILEVAGQQQPPDHGHEPPRGRASERAVPARGGKFARFGVCVSAHLLTPTCALVGIAALNL